MTATDSTSDTLRVRWLGRVDYEEAWDLQRRLHAGSQNHLLLLEHPPVYTIGRRGAAARLDDEAQPYPNLVVPLGELGAPILEADRGGDVTFHGPGQLVGYPILTAPGRRGGGLADTAAYVSSIEDGLIAVLAELGLQGGRVVGEPGVWLGVDSERPRKIAAVGVRLQRRRTMHGFALNNTVDLSWFENIVPCGITDKAVTSLAAEGISVDTEELVALVTRHLSTALSMARADTSADQRGLIGLDVESSNVVFRSSTADLAPFSRGHGPGQPSRPAAPSHGSASPGRSSAPVPVRLGRRLAEAGVGEGMDLATRKPEWMKVRVRTGENYQRLKKVSRELGLNTVCEEAGCPNIFDCWNEGTATFMLLGERCTRACGFCLVDTRKPNAVDEAEPDRIATAVEDLGLEFAVLTMVARDDLDDGGADIVARTVDAIHQRTPRVGIEVLVSDFAGNTESIRTVCRSSPDIFNHNIETVARLQRAVRPSAGYARSLTVLARAADQGVTTKSGIIVGMGETYDEVLATMADLQAVGVSIVTIGQYLRPTSNHLPIDRWWAPEEFEALKAAGEGELGLPHVEASPLTRSSHHAGSVARTVTPEPKG